MKLRKLLEQLYPEKLIIIMCLKIEWKKKENENLIWIFNKVYFLIMWWSHYKMKDIFEYFFYMFLWT